MTEYSNASCKVALTDCTVGYAYYEQKTRFGYILKVNV